MGALAAAVAAAVVVEPVAAQTPNAQRGHASRYAARTPTGARRGRPRKFSRPSRSVTLTLPDDVIAKLQAIDTDLSRAVVRALEPLAGGAPRPAAELTTFGDRAVIVVPPSRSLKERTGVELVPLSDGRALLSFDDRMSIADFELRLGDAIADPDVPSDEKGMFQELAEILRSARRADGVALKPRSIIVLQWTTKGLNGDGVQTASA
jgi:hypothetical protein